MARPRTLNLGHTEPPGAGLRRVGGNLALDFANTVDHDRAEPETLPNYGALIAWCEVSEVLTLAEARRLRGLSKFDPVDAGHWLEEAIALRRTAKHLFQARVMGLRGAMEDIAALNDKLRPLESSNTLVVCELGYARVSHAEHAPLALPVIRLAEAVADILTSRDFARVRLCEGAACGWFFIDRSPTRRRRWCSMAGCGNREKAHRHYVRKKSGGG